MLKKMFTGCLITTLGGVALLSGFFAFAYFGAAEDWDWTWSDPLEEVTWAGDYSGAYELIVSPQTALVTEPVDVRVTGLMPQQQVGLRASVQDVNGIVWQAAALYEADSNGLVDLTKHAPLSGSYAGASPMGLFWSMRPTSEVDSYEFVTEGQQYDVVLTLEADNQLLQTVSVQRLKVAENVQREDVMTDDVVGVFYYPAEGAPSPGVLIIGGSEGGIRADLAALWASHGYSTLAVGYFGVEGTPEYLSEIPLETFDHALDWLRANPFVDSEQIGVVGYSRGTEAAFLTAIENSDIDGVIAIMPSSVVWAGLDFSNVSENQGQMPSAWTRSGTPLPANSNRFSLELVRAMLGQPAIMIDSFQPGLENPEEGSVIPVEEINGSVLLISGSGDQLWPSTAFAEQITSQLAANDFAHEVKHVVLADAGHYIRPSWEPPIYIFGEPPTVAVFGGSRQVNGEAADAFWQAQATFFSEHLR